MKAKSGEIRYFTACVVVFTVFSLSIYTNIKEIKITNVPSNEIETQVESEQIEQVKVKEEENKKEEEEKKEEEVSQTVSSAKDYKGRVLSQYISPYSAKSSYSKVYMKNTTSNNINIKEMLNASLPFKIENTTQPQVLIVHTHTTERFMDNDSDYYTKSYSSRSRNTEKNMVKIGSIVAKKLNSAGIKTLHCKTEHDYPEYTGSYNRAANSIKYYLKKYPSIKVVIDLHRDAVSSGKSDKVKLVTEIKGKKAAQVMLVMGSQDKTNKSFPKWKENLKLAIKLQQELEESYPTLARPLYLLERTYNENLTTGSMLIEIGTDVNTIDEACRSAEYVGSALATVLKKAK